MVIPAPIAFMSMSHTHPQVVEGSGVSETLCNRHPADEKTRRYGVIIICSAFAGALGAMPFASADKAASAVELALALSGPPRNAAQTACRAARNQGGTVAAKVPVCTGRSRVFLPVITRDPVEDATSARRGRPRGTHRSGDVRDWRLGNPQPDSSKSMLRRPRACTPSGRDALRGGRNWDAMINSPVQQLRDSGKDVTMQFSYCVGICSQPSSRLRRALRNLTNDNHTPMHTMRWPPDFAIAEPATQRWRSGKPPRSMHARGRDRLLRRRQPAARRRTHLTSSAAHRVECQPTPPANPKSLSVVASIEARGSLTARELVKELNHLSPSEAERQIEHERRPKTAETVTVAIARRLAANRGYWPARDLVRELGA